jgi:voltage-gated potassium channel
MRNRLLRFSAAIVVIALGGTLGYIVLEGWSPLEAVYMTVITLSTVGFAEVAPLSTTGKLFTSGLIVAGVGSVAYLFASIGQHIVSGELTGSLRKARMQQRIEDLSGHYVICGFGRVAEQVIHDLQGAGKACVVVEERADAIGNVPTGTLTIEGDASDDEVLEMAGVDRAAGLVATTGDDAVNLIMTLTARTMNPDLVIVARCNQPASEPKLKRAGASQVISPYTISGARISRILLRPTIIDFLDVVMHDGQLELVLEECRVCEGSDLHGKTVAEAEVRRRTGANVLAVRRHDQGVIVTNPPSDMRFAPQDVLVALGTQEQLGALAKLGRDHMA